MEITNGLLVALLFVSLLGIGIAHVVMTMADLIRGDRDRLDGLVVTWTVILLLVYLDFFWNTTWLLKRETWEFAGFLYVVLGPILLFSATSMLLPGASLPESVSPRDHYLSVARRFFALLALLQVWIIGGDQLMGAGLEAGAALNAVVAVLFILLASTRQIKAHTVLTALVVLLYVSSFFVPNMNT